MSDTDFPPSDDSIANDLDLAPRTNIDGTAMSSQQKRNWLPILVLAMVVVAGGVIVTQFLTSAVDYYCNVDEINVRDGCDDNLYGLATLLPNDPATVIIDRVETDVATSQAYFPLQSFTT